MKFTGLALLALGASTAAAYVVTENTPKGALEARAVGSGPILASTLQARHRKYFQLLDLSIHLLIVLIDKGRKNNRREEEEHDIETRDPHRKASLILKSLFTVLEY